MKKLITKDKYEGLDPKVAEALKEGKEVYGEFWDHPEFRHKGYLKEYDKDDDRFVYWFINENGKKAWVKHFKPIYKEEEVDWSKVPEGTPIYIWDGNENPEKLDMAYFICYNCKSEYLFCTCRGKYEHAEIISEFQKK